MSAVEYMLDEQLVTLGLADAGAHVGQILDASQPTFLLSYWIRERQRWSLEEGVRRLTSDTADLFGLAGRGRLAAGSFADVNVIDFEALDLPAPSYVYDFPHGAGRYVQGSTGYDYTLVNGEVFMDHGEHTGAFAGAMLKNSAAAVTDTRSPPTVRLPSVWRHRRREVLRSVRVVPHRAARQVSSARVGSSRWPSTNRR